MNLYVQTLPVHSSSSTNHKVVSTKYKSLVNAFKTAILRSDRNPVLGNKTYELAQSLLSEPEDVKNLFSEYLSKLNMLLPPASAVGKEIISIKSYNIEFDTDDDHDSDVYHVSDSGADVSNPSEKEEEKSYADTAKSLTVRAKEIEEWLRNQYYDLIKSGDLSEESIQALVATLLRVKKEFSEYPMNRTPSRLYDWAFTLAGVTFPFPSLKTASGNVKFDQNFGLQLSWGPKNGRFVFPVRESLDDDDTYWGKLYDLINAVGGKVVFEASNDASVPDISETEVAKNDYFSHVFLRLVELAKSPGSATIRTGANLTKLEIARNHVDLVALDYIFEENKDKYQNLSVSPSINTSRRVIPNKRVTRDGKKSTVQVYNTYTGYALAQNLQLYVEKSVAKTPEGEPFFKLIKEIIWMLIARAEEPAIPKSFFEPPSNSIRSLIRKGPERAKQKGRVAKPVSYIPFSFVKSSDCSQMREVVKKTLTSCGSIISTRIDSINNLPIHEANSMVPWMKEYVQLCYMISDQLRKDWQTSCKVLGDVDILLGYFKEEFFDLSEDHKRDFLENLKKEHFKTVPNFDETTDQYALVKSVTEAVEKRKAERRKAR